MPEVEKEKSFTAEAALKKKKTLQRLRPATQQRFATQPSVHYGLQWSSVMAPKGQCGENVWCGADRGGEG